MNLPTLEELLALREGARHLALHTTAPVHGTLQGGHRSTHRGRGLEFQEVRPYVPGDDARSIDWRVTARRARPHTKLYREERERPVWLLADLDPTLFFGSRRQLKSAVVVRATALLAWVAARGGDRIGAVISGAGGYRILSPRAREAGVLPILSMLLEMQPRAPGPRSSPALTGALQALVPLVRPGSLVLVLSDFAALQPDSDPLWAALVAHSECRLFWVTDPLESEGLPPGRFRVGWADRSVVIDGASARASWVEAWRRRESRINELAERFRMTVTPLSTREPTMEALQTILRVHRSAA